MKTPAATQIYEVVLTGGPCGGKTSAIDYVVERLRRNGIAVIVVEEAASRVLSMIPDSGARAAILGDALRNEEFQDVLISAQLGDGERALRLAALLGSDRVVVLRDRDIIDNAAYIDRTVFNRLLGARGLTYAKVRDRSDLVIHMVTAADGAEAHYTTANNEARYETPAQARAQDRRTRSAWAGHRNRVVIDNSTGFDAKLERVWQAVAVTLGINVPLRGAPQREVA